MKKCSKKAWDACWYKRACELYAEIAEGSECDRFNEEIERKKIEEHETAVKWIDAADRKPKDFVSVLGCMTDAGDFPAVRECYTINGWFFFPALHEFHPVNYWAEMPEAPKHEIDNCRDQKENIK